MFARTQREQAIRSFGVVLIGGFVCAFLATLVLSKLGLVWAFLIPGCLIVFVPTFFVKDPERYWLSLFLFFLAFDIKKNLLDGLAVQKQLGLETFVPTIVPEITLSDLAFMMLLAFWVSRLVRGKASIYVPKVSILFAGYLSMACLSAFGAQHPYLSVVQLIRDVKLFVIFLYVVNNIDIKRWAPSIKIVILSLIILEGTLTFVRYRFQVLGLLGGSAFGRVTEDPTTSAHMLVQEEQFAGKRRGYGTLAAPSATAKFIVLLLPLSMLLVLRKSLGPRRFVYLAIFLVGVTGLAATYSRAALIALVGEIALAIWLAFRQGFITRAALNISIITAVVLGLIGSPIMIYFLRTRPANVSIRRTQFAGTLRMILDNPVFGVGLNNSTVALEKYTPGTSGPATDPTKRSFIQPIHDYYLALLSEIGIIGFLFYMSFFVSICRLGFRRLLLVPAATGFMVSVFLVSIIGLGIELLADPLNEISVIVLLWFFAAGILGSVETKVGRKILRPSGAVP